MPQRGSSLYQKIYWKKPGYHKSKWTANEWKLAYEERDNPKRTRSLQMVEVLMGGKPSGKIDKVIPVEGINVEQLADKLVDFLENQ